MEHGIDSSTVSLMDRSTVKLRWINNPHKHSQFITGFFIQKIGRLAIIFSVAHFVKDSVKAVPNIEDYDVEELEIVCHGSAQSYPCRIELVIPESEILVLSCYTDTEIQDFLKFTSKEEWEGEIKGQKIFSTSHSTMLGWRADEAVVASSNYLNGKTVPEYDPNMIFFDHSMAMGVGSSGAAILNMNRNILGVQSGGFLLKQKVMCAGPWECAYLDRKTGIKEKDENLGISLSNVSLKARDIGVVSTRRSNMNFAVHISYLDAVLRKRLSYLILKDNESISLNDLVLKYVYEKNYLSE